MGGTTGSPPAYGLAVSGSVGIGTRAPIAKLDVSGSGRFTAGLNITGSAGTGSAVTIYKSGSTALDIQGSSGQLFAVTDSLTGSLFSVNTAAGLPTIVNPPMDIPLVGENIKFSLRPPRGCIKTSPLR